MESEYLFEMNHIEKEYFGNKVLKDVSIRVKKGEILALIGENGAGKSTIMNILFGMPVIRETGGFKGELLLEGNKVTIDSPTAAMKMGIGMVHQEFMLIDNFNVMENIKLNREVTKGNIASAVFGKNLETLDNETMYKQARETLKNLCIELSETAVVANLAVGHKQFVEIARELDKSNIKLIVLDEPTAVLTETDAEIFLDCIKKVAKKGVAIIFISHRLDEIVNTADRVAILRDGELVGDYDVKHMNAIKMSELMVGREIEILNHVPAEQLEKTDTLMELKNFSIHMPTERCRNVNLEIKKGEILGIGGLAGHGKTSIATGVMGLYPSTGEVLYKGKELDVKNTQQTLRSGIMFVSEDRRGTGLMLEDTIEHNINVASMYINNNFLKQYGFFRFYDKKSALEQAKRSIKELDIRCTGPDQPVKRLSGGNQQKVCLARALLMNSEVLFISEPTRGIDIGAKKMILDLLLRLNEEQKMTIVITSSELAELRSVCGRIAIMTEGTVAGILKPDDPDYKFGLLMSGITELDSLEVG